MKKVVKSFEQPMEVKNLSNYVDSERIKRTFNLKNPKRRYIESYIEIPDQNDVSVIDEFDEYVTQRFVVRPDGEWDVNAFLEDEAKWNKKKWKGEKFDYYDDRIGEDFWELLYTYVPEDLEPGTYEVTCYMDLVYEVDEIVYDSEGFVIDYSTPKLNLNDSKLDDLELRKLN